MSPGCWVRLATWRYLAVPGGAWLANGRAMHPAPPAATASLAACPTRSCITKWSYRPAPARRTAGRVPVAWNDPSGGTAGAPRLGALALALEPLQQGLCVRCPRVPAPRVRAWPRLRRVTRAVPPVCLSVRPSRCTPSLALSPTPFCMQSVLSVRNPVCCAGGAGGAPLLLLVPPGAPAPRAWACTTLYGRCTAGAPRGTAVVMVRSARSAARTRPPSWPWPTTPPPPYRVVE